MNLPDNSSMDSAKKRRLEENGVLFPPDLPATTTTLSLDDLRKIIEPFTQEQLFQIVLTASGRHPDVLDAVRSIADRDHTQRKLFIRGLGWETTSEKLRTVFATYGDLEEAIVILDKGTGKSKGYGFVTYRHVDGALMALKEPSKKIDGRMTVTQLASAGFTGGVPLAPNSQTVDVSSRKIYVANVPYDMPGERLLAHFSSYGEVEEGPLGFDKTTGKSRGFALFVYKSVEGARASLVDPIKTIDGHQLNCKLANDTKRGNHSALQPPTAALPAQVQGPAAGIKPEVNVDRQGLNLNQQSSLQGSFAGGISAYGGNSGGLGLLGRPGGISAYGGNSGGLGLPGQGPLPLGHSQHHLNFNLGGGPGLSSLGSIDDSPGLSSIGGQAPSSLGSGSVGFSSGLGGGGGYGGSHFGGPGASYDGLGSAGGAGLGGAGSGFGGSGQRSLCGLPPGSVRMSSGGYPESAHYSLSSGAAYQSQHHQQTGTSPITRVPAGGSYQGPPYN